MVEYIWRGKTATITITDPAGNDVPVGILQDVDVGVEAEDSELRGAGSTKVQDVMRSELTPTVSGTVSAFDEDVFDTLVDYDSTNTELQGSKFTPPKFDVEVAIGPTSTGATKTIKVTNVYFSDVPLSTSSDEWVELDLDGRGDDITSLDFS